MLLLPLVCLFVCSVTIWRGNSFSEEINAQDISEFKVREIALLSKQEKMRKNMSAIIASLLPSNCMLNKRAINLEVPGGPAFSLD